MNKQQALCKAYHFELGNRNCITDTDYFVQRFIIDTVIYVPSQTGTRRRGIRHPQILLYHVRRPT